MRRKKDSSNVAFFTKDSAAALLEFLNRDVFCLDGNVSEQLSAFLNGAHERRVLLEESYRKILYYPSAVFVEKNKGDSYKVFYIPRSSTLKKSGPLLMRVMGKEGGSLEASLAVFSKEPIDGYALSGRHEFNTGGFYRQNIEPVDQEMIRRGLTLLSGKPYISRV